MLFQSGMPYKYWKMAAGAFCALYNSHHVDMKNGTVPYIERHGAKFPGKLIQFGAKIRYLPSAERELEKREKLDASLRDGIFVGYRMHSGGRWTGQRTVLDIETHPEISEAPTDVLTSTLSAKFMLLAVQATIRRT